jgi:protein N-terminal methyltransferase
LGSRLFLLNLYPELSTVPSAFRPLNTTAHPNQKRTRALDVGAGIGRVTADVLLHLVTDVVLVEPVNAFIQEAMARARASALDKAMSPRISWPGLADESKSVTFLQDTLQQFQPLSSHLSQFHDRIGYQPPGPIDDTGKVFDVIWCQWCLGYLTNPDLVAFLRRSHEALNPGNPRSLIVVKENLCRNDMDGSALEVFDEEDSSLTRFL